MKAYQLIEREAAALEERLCALPVNGKKTSPGTLKDIKRMVSDSTYILGMKCNAFISFPQMSIHGKEVKLGEPSIIMPDGVLVSLGQLKELEESRKVTYGWKKQSQRGDKQ